MEILDEILKLIVDNFRLLVVLIVAIIVVAGVYNAVEPNIEGQWKETLENIKSMFSTSIYIILAISSISTFLIVYALFRRGGNRNGGY